MVKEKVYLRKIVLQALAQTGKKKLKLQCGFLIMKIRTLSNKTQESL